MCVNKRSRPDIRQTSMVLSTRVKEPNENDWKKLVIMIKYFNGKMKNYLNPSDDYLKVVKWYVDSSFVVHPYFESHTRAIMTMGQGYMESVSNKQKLNTSIITGAELVDVDDASVYILWTVLFNKFQGYNIEKNILYQDNKSAIMLEVNSKSGEGKRIRALNICYFSMICQVEKRNLQIKYCQIYEMWGNFMTNPTQVEHFRNFKNCVLGGNEYILHGKEIYTQKWENFLLFGIDKYHKRKECVGECRQMLRKQ